MTFQGHILNGVVVFEGDQTLPEGTPVRIEVLESAPTDVSSSSPRVGGQYAGQIRMAPDFDEWPADLQETLGMTQ